MIQQEKQGTFANLAISLEPGTNKTTTLSLQSETSDFYVVKLTDGTIIQLKKDLVSGIIFK